jgi:hypothetical protein
VALQALRGGGVRAEVVDEAVVPGGEGSCGFGQGVDRDLAGEGVFVEHGEEDEHLVALRHGGVFELVEEGSMAFERALLPRLEAAEALHEPEPAAVGGPCCPGVVALVEGFQGSWPGAVKLRELLVIALEGLLPVRRDFDEASEDVDRLELVGDEAAGCDLDRAFSGSFQEVKDFLAAGREAEERLGLQQEGAVVADVVDDGELLVVVRLP